MACAAMWPSHTAIRHAIREPNALAADISHCPSRARSRLCRLSVENVVKPPRNPVMKKCRWVASLYNLPSGPVSVAKNPMMKQPITFTAKVPHGKFSPKRADNHAERPKRAMPPRPLPIAIHK